MKRNTIKVIGIVIALIMLCGGVSCSGRTAASSLPALSEDNINLPVQPINIYMGPVIPLAPYPNVDLTEIKTMPVYEIKEYDSSTDALEATLKSMEYAGLMEAANLNIINGTVETTQEEIEAEKTKLIEFAKNYFSTNSGPYCKNYDTYTVESYNERGRSVILTAKMELKTTQDIILDYAYVWDRIVVELWPERDEFNCHPLSAGTTSTENYTKMGDYEIIPYEEAKRIILSNESDKFIWMMASETDKESALESGKFDAAPIYLSYCIQSVDGKTYARPVYVQTRQLESGSSHIPFVIIDALKR